MLITAIVCTHNRCQALAKALQSIAASVVPKGVEWEVLVVDNNSTDQTRGAVDDCSQRYPGRFRYLFEPLQGLSFARNAGVREARGEIVAFTDDDVVVEPTWLWALTEALQGGEWAGTGGRIVPLWDRPLPRWLSLEGVLLSGPFVALDLGPEPAPMMQAPVGANMAFRREAFERFGLFRTDLGRVGEGPQGACEDAEFGKRLLVVGARLRYEPSAVVYHPVPANRLDKHYLHSWYFSHGYSEIVMSGIPSEAKWRVAGVPLVLFRRLGRWSAQWLVSAKPSERFQCTLRVCSVAGAMRASYQLSRRAQENTGTLRGERRSISGRCSGQRGVSEWHGEA
jgi:glucosyl-dolichyl phosphate glucuronosyltransferase